MHAEQHATDFCWDLTTVPARHINFLLLAPPNKLDLRGMKQWKTHRGNFPSCVHSRMSSLAASRTARSRYMIESSEYAMGNVATALDGECSALHPPLLYWETRTLART